MPNKKRVPRVQQHVFKVSIRSDMVPFWEQRVQPMIDRLYDGNRSAFILDAVKDFVDRKGRVTRL